MTDAHCHVSCGDSSVRELLVGRDFFGVHPWETLDDGTTGTGETTETSRALVPDVSSLAALLPSLRAQLLANPAAGVGEIGLDRLKSRVIDPAQRAAFAAQLEVAAEFRRPVVLHGAKCWGEVVAACRPYAGRIPAFLFHGFSRSGGLLPEIVALNGFVGVGAALLNDHAVNYRTLVKEIPAERLLVETDADYGCDTSDAVASARRPYQEGWALVAAIARKLAEIRGVDVAELESAVEANALRFVEALA